MKHQKASLAALRKLWRQVQEEQTRFIKRVDELETEFRRQHKLKPQDASIVWLDEMIIGIESRQGPERKMLYDDDLK